MEDSAGNGNHSDSDTSSESWTFVEPNIPTVEIQNSVTSSDTENLDQKSVPNETSLTEQVPEEGEADGVAVITDDEDVSSTVTDTVPTWFASYPPLMETKSRDSLRPCDPETSSTATFRDSEEELPDDFYLADEKIKLYVHRRNNKVSSMLNIILLGTVVTAVTLAAGFTWGINDTCSLDMLNSVNKILANLQKLQHENDLLKSKIKMLQFMQHNRPIKDDSRGDYFQQIHNHEMFDNIFDTPQNLDSHFHSKTGPTGRNVNKVYHYVDGKDAYLESNESEDETFPDSETVSKHAMKSSEGKDKIKTDKSTESPIIGPKNYNPEDKSKSKNSCRSSGKIDSSNEKLRGDKNIKKKDKKFKKENTDWYQKLHKARKLFRERGYDDYNFIGKGNKANWYFKRMNDREKHREATGPSIRKRQKEFFKSKQ